MERDENVKRKSHKEESLAEHICDELCKHPGEAADQEALDEICRECPLGIDYGY